MPEKANHNCSEPDKADHRPGGVVLVTVLEYGQAIFAEESEPEAR